jgi:erythromycin esterase-like protein
LGDDYYAIGFDFYQGTFQANDIDLKDSPGWEEHEVKAAPHGNLSSYFVQAGLDDSFVDFTLTTKSNIISDWLTNKKIPLYSIGSQFSKNWPAISYIAPTRLYNAFDGVIFIKESNRAVPIERLSINIYKF